MSKNVKTVKRFNKGFIIAHWLNAFSFFMLYVSGLPLYTDWFDWLYIFFGGPEMARLVHRISAICFLLPIPIMIIFDFAGFKNWMKNLFSWKKHDFEFFKEFPKEFFGRKSNMPKQDFFNAGEKLNSWLTIICGILLIGSGFIMWMPHAFPKFLVTWAYPMHNIGFGLAAAVVVGHIFLSVYLYRESLRGITDGDVSIEYAKDHHGRWYDELKAQGKVD